MELLFSFGTSSYRISYFIKGVLSSMFQSSIVNEKVDPLPYLELHYILFDSRLDKFLHN